MSPGSKHYCHCLFVLALLMCEQTFEPRDKYKNISFWTLRDEWNVFIAPYSGQATTYADVCMR